MPDVLSLAPLDIVMVLFLCLLPVSVLILYLAVRQNDGAPAPPGRRRDWPRIALYYFIGWAVLLVVVILATA